MKWIKSLKKKSKADFCDDNKKGLVENEKGLWHDQPKTQTHETQEGASRVKIAGPNEKDKFEVELVLSTSENSDSDDSRSSSDRASF